MQASHINVQQGSLLLILGTTMQFGYGHVHTLCTARARRAHSAQYAPLVHCTVMAGAAGAIRRHCQGNRVLSTVMAAGLGTARLASKP